jgi:hypothetical protein
MLDNKKGHQSGALFFITVSAIQNNIAGTIILADERDCVIIPLVFRRDTSDCERSTQGRSISPDAEANFQLFDEVKSALIDRKRDL